jgi:hypothetical protein
LTDLGEDGRKINIKMNLNEIVCGRVDWDYLDEGRVH